jgi:hypothetical protein
MDAMELEMNGLHQLLGEPYQQEPMPAAKSCALYEIAVLTTQELVHP